MRKRKITYTYQMPHTGDDPAANLALFLTLNEGSCYRHWRGHMRAADQRTLFGEFLGKGRILIDGDSEMLFHTRKVCFGLDSDVTHRIPWRDLTYPLAAAA